MAVKKRKDLIMLESGSAAQPFNYSVGLYGSYFFQELKENRRFMGVCCPKCKKVYIPPRQVCGPCFAKMTQWTPVGPEGVIKYFTILRFAFLDPETGEKRPVPYGYGYIRLDGADTNFQHFINLPVHGTIRIGDRVRPVFTEKLLGNLRDIQYFEKIN